jgi:hypothetical protein
VDNGADASRSAAKRSAVDGPAIAPVDTAFSRPCRETIEKVRRVETFYISQVLDGLLAKVQVQVNRARLFGTPDAGLFAHDV